mmetsp:Transcript_21184/g.33210  ORF Transcript_21184/g.33210 Transcript_21184/m.33210 type:complete len:93 (+) Transcript_21184:482-760(+)
MQTATAPKDHRSQLTHHTRQYQGSGDPADETMIKDPTLAGNSRAYRKDVAPPKLQPPRTIFSSCQPNLNTRSLTCCTYVSTPKKCGGHSDGD